jgi:hypothetical protein
LAGARVKVSSAPLVAAESIMCGLPRWACTDAVLMIAEPADRCGIAALAM